MAGNMPAKMPMLSPGSTRQLACGRMTIPAVVAAVENPAEPRAFVTVVIIVAGERFAERM